MMRTLPFAAIAAAALALAPSSAPRAAAEPGAGNADAREAKIFESSDAAAQALADAWRSGERDGLLAIFGAEGEDLVVSGDPVAEKHARTRLLAEYVVAHRIEPLGGNGARLILGALEFPYPIPLAKSGDGWKFDTRSGAQEILHRRIGRNELNAIDVCRSYVEAQRAFAARRGQRSAGPEYAMKIVSSEGARDGLYWPAQSEEDESPLGPLVAAAAAEGYGDKPLGTLAPYHGYFYRVLTAQGPSARGGAASYVVDGRLTRGFGLVAYPAKYRDSGVMTFVVNQEGIVFEKDLGLETADRAREMTLFDPDPSWKIP